MSEQGNLSNTWNSANYGVQTKFNQLNCVSPQMSSYFYNPSLDNNSLDQNDPFESALSSMVSSPTAVIPTCRSAGNGGDISPPKPSNLSMVDHHQIRRKFLIPDHNLPSRQIPVPFAERAAVFPCFSNNLSGNLQFPHKLEEPVSQFCKISGSTIGEEERSFQEQKSVAEFVDSREGSSVSYQISGSENANARKRKSDLKNNSNVKRNKEANEEDEDANDDKSNSKPPPPNDFIHVRARRGQATDSHSLAERVRREKLSGKMKFLQDLVPGCNKVTGKAVMLDEIINYVQSLQRQVEFLSMKLNTISPRMDLNLENFLSKDIFLPMEQQNSFPLESGLPPFAYGFQYSKGSGEPVSSSQVTTIWNDDEELQGVVKMSLGENGFQNVV